MRALKVIGAGLAAGLLGAAVWAGVAYATNRELGLVAWGIGGVVGLAVRVAAREWEGVGPGGIAAGVAVLAVAVGKYAAVSLLIGKAVGGITVVVTDQDMIREAAEEVVKERVAQGKRVAWPAGMTAETATKPEDYQRDVWAEATKRWNAHPAAERAALIDEKQKQERKQLDATLAGMKGELFRRSFGPFDILWFGLAVVTAARLGAGTVRTE